MKLAFLPLGAVLSLVLSAVLVGASQDDPPPAEATVLVVIVDEDGKPLEGATVVLLPTKPKRNGVPKLIIPKTADAEGRVRLRVPVGEAHTLRLRAPSDGGESLKRDLPAVVDGQILDMEVTLRTRDDATFTGLVVDAATGETIEGAGVGAVGGGDRFIGLQADYGRLTPPRRLLAASDAEGLFAVEAATWRELGLGIFAEGYVPCLLTAGGTDGAPGLGVEPRKIALERPATIQVEVLDPPEGLSVRALVGVRSYLDPMNGSTSGTSLDKYAVPARRLGGEEAGEDGDERATFVIEGLPAGKNVYVEFRRGEKVLRVERNVRTPGAGEERRQAFDLFADGSIDVVALGLDGEPLAGEELWIGAPTGIGQLSFQSYDEPLAKATTDENGRARFRGLALGSYLVAPKGTTRFTADFPKAVMAGARREITRQDPRLETELKKVEAQTISGLLRDERGKPSEGHVTARLKASGWGEQLSVGPDGQFSIGGLIPGTYRVTGSKSMSVGSLPVEAEAGAEGVELVARDTGGLSGRAMIAGTGAPAPQATVRFCDRVTENQHSLNPDGEARFQIDVVAAGKHHMLAWTEDGLISPLVPVEVPVGGTVENVTVALEPGAVLEISPSPSDARTTVWVRFAGDGMLVSSSRAGEPVRMTVPTGPIDVTVKQTAAGLARSLALDLKPGEERLERVELEVADRD